MHVGEHRRRVEPAGADVEPPAALEHLGALGQGPLDLVLDPRARPLRDERPHVGLGVHPVPDPQRSRLRDESLDERLGDRLDDVDALGRGADLTVVEEARPRRARHRDVEIGVLEHDQRIDAAELEVDPLELRGRA